MGSRAGPPMTHHVFKTVMIGPASDYPHGSAKRAESLAISLHYTVLNVTNIGSGRLIAILEETYAEEPKPWEVWPENEPCKSPDAYFRQAAGVTADQLRKMVAAFDPNHPLLRKLSGDQARSNPAVKQGGDRKSTSYKLDDPIPFGSTSSARILARLARDNPDILAAYERGEYKSARSAGIAAGIIKPPSGLDVLRSAWRKATADERAIFRDEIM